MNKTFILEF